MKHHKYTVCSVCLFHSSFSMCQVCTCTHPVCCTHTVQHICETLESFMHHCLHFPPNFSLTWLMSSGSLELPLQFKIKLYEYERCLTLQQEAGETVLCLVTCDQKFAEGNGWSYETYRIFMKFSLLSSGCDIKILMWLLSPTRGSSSPTYSTVQKF